MSRVAILTALCVVILSGALSSSSLSAQSPPLPWNRKFEAISVHPVPGRPGMYDIQPFFTVEAGATTAPLNLSTRADVLVNGSIVKRLVFSIFADPAASAGCNIPCHEMGQVCVCVEGILCSCGTVLVCDPPFPSALRPGDEITVILQPMPGALPDADDEDDRFSIVFEGKPIGWDRRIAGVRLTPQRGDTVDVEVAVDAFASYAGALRLDAEVAVLVNGKPAQAAPVAADDFVWASCSPGCASSACGKGSGGGTGQCQQEIQEYGTFCWCAAADWGVVRFTGLEAGPGDEITVILLPAPGALPDRMGDAEADERTLVVPGSRAVGNRKVEGLSVTPIPGAPRGHYQLQLYFSVEALPTPSPLDLSTEAEILLNGKPIQATRHRITTDPSGAAGCNVPCHELGKVCVCVDGVICGCGTILVNVPPTAAELSPTDEIAVILRPASGAAPDADVEDDRYSFAFEGQPIGWDRKIESLSLVPVPGAPASLFLPQLQLRVEAPLTPSPLDLSTEVELRVNGKPVQATRHRITTDPSGAAGCNVPCHELGKVCVCVDGVICGCGTLLISPDFDPVELEPGDEIAIILRPAPGALPELPGMDEDESIEIVRRPTATLFRRGDVNDDGRVDMGDAVASLGWQFLGTKAPGCPDAADTDDNGEIGIGDAIGLLNWLFLGAAPPRQPGPFECGEDPTEDKLPVCQQETCSVLR